MTPPILHLVETKNLKDFIQYSETDQDYDAPHNQRASCNPNADWNGVSTKEEAYSLFRKGWPEGTERVKTILAALQHLIKLPTLSETIDNDVEGVTPDIEASIQGRPEDMIIFPSVEVDAPPSILNVQLEMICSSVVTVTQLSYTGAILMAVQERLRMQGCAVHYTLAYTVHNFNQTNCWQAYTDLPQTLDIDTMAFVMANPAMMRVIAFSIMEHEPKEVRTIFGINPGGGYGRVPFQRKMDKSDIMLQIQDMAMSLPYNESDILKTACQYVNTLVETKFQKFK